MNHITNIASCSYHKNISWHGMSRRYTHICFALSLYTCSADASILPAFLILHFFVNSPSFTAESGFPAGVKFDERFKGIEGILYIVQRYWFWPHLRTNFDVLARSFIIHGTLYTWAYFASCLVNWEFDVSVRETSLLTIMCGDVVSGYSSAHLGIYGLFLKFWFS